MPDVPVISPTRLASGTEHALSLDAHGRPEAAVLAVDLDAPATLRRSPPRPAAPGHPTASSSA